MIDSRIERFFNDAGIIIKDNVSFKEESKKSRRKLFPCPFLSNVAIRFPNEILIEESFDYCNKRDEEFLGGLIHEAGHLLCNKNVRGEEFRFFGWEFLVAVKYNLLNEWEASSYNYGIGNNEVSAEFGEVDKDEQSDTLDEAIFLATKHGFVKNGEPIFIR